MENANGYEYLEKIKTAVIENLKKTAPVPSVQMQDIPRASMGMTDEQEDELDDMDEDENKDVRITQRQWEKKVQRQEEFEDSDDEEMAEANGVYKPNGRTRRSILEFQNPNAVDDDMEIDSGVATPAQKAAEAPVDNDDTVVEDADVEAAPITTEAPSEPAPAAENEPSKTDYDGDVDMADSTDGKDAEATIKEEEVDGAAISESTRKKSPIAEAIEAATDGVKETSKDEAPAEEADEAAKGNASDASDKKTVGNKGRG